MTRKGSARPANYTAGVTGGLVLRETTGAVAVLTMNRPEKLNAWNAAMREELMGALSEANSEAAVRAIVLTGTGRAFCAGQDLGEGVRLDEAGAGPLVDAWRGFCLLLLDLEKPLVAAVNGPAVGAAFTAALLSDLRVGHPGTRFIYGEINAGLPATVGPTLMAQFFGRGRMQEIWLTGRPIEAEEAMAIGLLNRLVPEEELVPTAVELATVLALKPAVAMRLNKRWNRELLLPTLEENFAAARRYTAEAIASGEPQRVMEEFLARRRGAS